MKNLYLAEIVLFNRSNEYNKYQLVRAENKAKANDKITNYINENFKFKRSEGVLRVVMSSIIE